MPANTNLNISPYFDDFNANSNYMQVLFKPGVALQTRELNAVQSQFQNQIETFGDNIFAKGTIVSGCNFTYLNNYPYVKINDIQQDGLQVVVGNYNGLYATSNSGLTAYILNSNTGYQAQAPNLNTLFVRYINSGNTGTQTQYNANDTLTIYNPTYPITQVNVPVGFGGGFSNSDNIIFIPQIAVPSSVAVAVNQTATDASTNARATVVSVNTTAMANQIVVGLGPVASDLTNTSITSSFWTFNTGDSILFSNATANVSTSITSVFGYGANAVPTADSTGKITSAIMISGGSGYKYTPYTTIKTSNTSANISFVSGATSDLYAQNYLAQVTVANNSVAPTGMGYAFQVSSGTIYQKGYFLQVNSQTVVVDQYSNLPDQVSVGFATAETIINSNIDSSLLDNATGAPNYLAPGADRLKLSPELIVVPSSAAIGNANFFTITAFSNGQPYLQNQQTEYNVINDAMAQRTYDTSGNFVVNPFNVVTAVDSVAPSSSFTTVIDAGEAYISGYRVKTDSNYNATVKQGTDTNTISGATVPISYGNYILVDQLSGVINFNVGDYVYLYDTPAQYLTNSYTASSITPVGNQIGIARIRSIVPISGTPGTPSFTCKVYLFDINMYLGLNFQNVRSIYYNNQTTGIADIITSSLLGFSSNGANITTGNSSVVFNIGASSTQQTNGHVFTYTGIFNSSNGVSINSTSGYVSLTLAGNNSFLFGNNATLTKGQVDSVILTFPANVQATSNLSGTLSVSSTSNIATFSTGQTVYPGQYLKLFTNSSFSEIKRVDSVLNTTQVQLDSNTINSNTAVTSTFLYVPENVPVSLASGNVSSSGTTLSLNVGIGPFTTVSSAAVVIPIIEYTNLPSQKKANRNTTVLINPSTNNGGLTGPWCLGIPDIFRLKKVYQVPTSTPQNIPAVNIQTGNIPSTWVDVTSNFFIDISQTKDYYGLGYLNSLSSTTQSLPLVVVFDHFTSSTTGPSFYTRSSYSVNDTLSFSALSSNTSINTLEIPEFVDSKGNYYDLIDCVDFRPYVNITSNITSGNVQSSTINPVDYGIVLAQGTFNSNSTITNIANTAGIISGAMVLANSSLVATGTVVTSYINSTAVAISTNALGSGSANIIFNSEPAKFSSNAIYFPLDGSTFSANLTYYMGRSDLVCVDNKSNFNIIAGTPGTSTVHTVPANNIALSILTIPAYPSIPSTLDQNTTNIVDLGVRSSNRTYNRSAVHTINTNASTTQPSVFTMSAIQSLQDRISALESQASLTALEIAMNNVTIPSSLSSALNRFKYGFFTDTFANTNYADITSSEFTASISNNSLYANTFITNIPLRPAANTTSQMVGNLLLPPFIEVPVISQSIATLSSTISVEPVPYAQGTIIANPPSFQILSKSVPITTYTNTSVPTTKTVSVAGVQSAGWYLAYPVSKAGIWSSLMKEYAIWTGGAYDIATRIFTTEVYFPYSGTYTFTYDVDNYGTILLDNTSIITMNGFINIVTSNITVSAGIHTLSLSVTNAPGSGLNPAGIALTIEDTNNNLIWSTLEAISQ